MELLALVILVFFMVLGFGFLFLNGPSTLLIFLGGLFYAMLTGFDTLGWNILLVLGLIYLAGEILDTVFVLSAAHQFGASRQALVGGFLGGLAGTLGGFLLAGIGVVPGFFLGVFGGLFLGEYKVRRDAARSLKAGLGGVAGVALSMVVKALLAVAMIAILLIRILPPLFPSR